MIVRFFIDEETNEPPVLGHNASEVEVLEVLSSNPERMNAKEGALQAVGQTLAGRYLKVIYTEEDDGDLFVITAYELGPKALRAFKRRRRRRHKR